ncbi:YciI family protein [Brevibacillus parabrevis]|uniref:YciI family protein n=1 Tax=Brevibacillus parabrevis TaxID=54914 RepID=UPI002E1FD8D2|nr:YciI family protein [Brevibacillus parabrevis]
MDSLQQFLYKLKLVPRLLEPANWTDREHFRYLQQLLAENRLILAGRTQNMDETTFGIAIFLAESEEAAASVMANDPAVKQEVMTAELYLYRVALYNSQWEKQKKAEEPVRQKTRQALAG